MSHLRILLLLVSLALAGCVGAPSSFGGASSGVLEVDSGTEALGSLGDDEEWQEAPAGCEDLLDSERLTFMLASLHDHLVAAVDSSGDIVCVDTVESVQAELEEQGEEERAAELGDSFLVALTIAAMPNSDLRAADPTPQPNTEMPSMPRMGPQEGDPTPQPNTQP